MSRIVYTLKLIVQLSYVLDKEENIADCLLYNI